MRLHQLTAVAFGPFADPVVVDFDELSAGGLFLLTGDTGAGKTSVLDAVCFALYGEVPGDRHSARHLRSDHAAPTAEPRVALELTVGERTFRFTRSPAWERPKKRGTGTTRVQAHVTVEELDEPDEWRLLTHRLDEAGQLVVSLLGMTCAQFTQVAMLPQGRFQAFLRASSAERQAVLQRLFRTSRFEAVERWLADHRVTLRRESSAHFAEVAAAISRFEEAADAERPGGLRELDSDLDDAALLTWATGTLTDSVEAATSIETSLAAATRVRAAAQARLESGRRTTDDRARGLLAREALAELDATADVQRDAMARLEAHGRAGGVLPLATRAAAATAALDEAESAAAVHVDRTARLLGLSPDDVDEAALDAAASVAGERRAVAAAWLPREKTLVETTDRCLALTDEVERLTTSLGSVTGELAGIDPAVEQTRDALHVAEREARSLADRRSTLERVEAAASAAHDAVGLGQRLTEQRAVLAETTQRVQDIREEHLDLREARISGMAAELAGALAVGCSCPVCGSAEHPAPATAFSRVTRDDEERARASHEQAAFEQQALQESVTTLDTQLRAALLTSGGHRPEHWSGQVEHARRAHGAAETATAEATRLRGVLAELEATRARLADDVAERRVTLSERAAVLSANQHQLSELETGRSALLAEHGGPELASVDDLVRRLAADVSTLTAARTSIAAAERASQARAQAVAEVLAAATDAGFASVRAAVAAHLREAEVRKLTEVLEARRSARAAAEAVLVDDAVVEALEADAVDVEALAAAATEADDARDRHYAAHEVAVARATRLQALHRGLTAALDAWLPVRQRLTLVAGLAALAEGTSSANVWKMRLSAYVLSERLRQVVAAANERLGAMTDQRFALEQVDERGAGEQRGGLSLRVRDEWSGTERDPATLSGGETFLVSLALALGLADTVSHEAGGTQLDTLFIDEGFGALDATTLDGVMDTLDSLRDGGRVVGVVSHVPELRNRVTTQLEVRKGRRGSTVAAAHSS